jgi:RNA polymerase sigma-70 factor (ECF subfamily)
VQGVLEATAAKDDAGLLAAARRLDSRALAAIHDRYYPDLYRYLLYRTNDPPAAEDLTSEVFMRFLDALHTGKRLDHLPAWLFGVAGHLAADHFRRQARRPQVELVDEMMASGIGPEALAENNQRAAAVRQALSQLTDEQQQVLALRFGQGHSIDMAAGAMQKSATAVKQLQFRAIAALRRRLEGVA